MDPTLQERWEREYATLKVMVSSNRDAPSKALLMMLPLIDLAGMRRVLDVGCGNGRNAVYLAGKGCEVHALDFSATALGQLAEAAARAGVSDRIHPHQHTLEGTLPFADESFDLVLSSYFLCHFPDDEFRTIYRQELRRVLRPGGLVFCSVHAVEDGYYGPMIRDPAVPWVVDGRNLIGKWLHTEAEIKRYFAPDFRLVHFLKYEFDDVLMGQNYWRSILVLLIARPSACRQ